MVIGNIIRNIRREKRLTIRELAKKSSMSISTISYIENNKNKPSLGSIEKLSKALDVNSSIFLNTGYQNNNIIFTNPSDAIRFMLEQPIIMNNLNFNIQQMNENDIINFTNDILKQLKLVSYKYKK